MKQKINNRLAQAAGCLSPPVLRLLEPHFSELEQSVQEIRLRVGCPVCIVSAAGVRFPTLGGTLTDVTEGDVYRVSREDIETTFQRACGYSVYARQKEVVNGFITLPGGHRMGLCGTAVTESGAIINVRGITSLNLRIAHERRGCGTAVFHVVRRQRGGVLICGAPCSGKTTLLRDLARLFSAGDGKAVSLIDERGELAAVTMGEPQNDVGFCDVFDGYPKAKAMEQALRTMSPQIIICDEIGSADDVEAVRQCLHSGVRVIATAHAEEREDLYARPSLRRLLDTGAFESFVFLRGRDHAGEVDFIDSEGERRAA